jgi:flavin-dependent dehydrogenase
VQPLLQQLGIWGAFTALQPLPSYGTRSLWGAPDPREHAHVMSAHGCGWHVERACFDALLAESARSAGAELRLGVEVVRIEPLAAGFELGLVEPDGLVARASAAAPCRSVRADFVLDAAGRASPLPRRLGAERARFDRLVGVGVQFEDPSAVEHCYTLVEASVDGWWYAAPAARDRSVVMLMTDGDLTSTRASRSVAGWRRALARTELVRRRVAGRVESGAPRVFAAVSQRLLRERRDERRWLSLGDSALAVDPVSGSGVIRALRTAHAGASAVLATARGESDAILAYEAARDQECTRYLQERTAYYRAEQRFEHTPFWARRSRTPLAAASA